MTDKKKMMKLFAGFLAAMLIMTFVSRAVYAKSLPLVQVKEAKTQRLTRMIRCGGTVVPTAVKSVFLPEGLTVEQMCVSGGCAVKKDEALLMLDTAQLKEKALTLENEIEELKEQSEQSKSGTPVFAEPDMPVSKVNVGKGDTVEKGDVLFTVDSERLLRLINELETERNSDIINRDGCLAAAQKAEGDAALEEAASQQKVQAAVYDCNIKQEQQKIDRYLAVYKNGGRVCAPCSGTVTAVKISDGDLTAESAAVLIGERINESSAVREKEKLLKKYRCLIKDGGIVRSETDGTVTSAPVNAGEQTTASAAVCIADNSQKMYFHAELSEEDAKQVSAGDQTDVVLHNGKLKLSCRIEAVVKRSGTGYTAIVPIDCTEALCGDIGELRIQAAAEESSICVPTSALFGSDHKYLFILKKEDGFIGEEYRAERVDVTAGYSNDSMTALSSSGLGDGDKIICTDKKLTDGQTVRLSG